MTSHVVMSRWRRPLAGLLLAPALCALQAQVPSAPPPPMPLTPATLPPFQEATLRNGVRVVLVENHRQPSVVFRLAVPAGSRFDPSDKSGTSDLVATLLTKGAGSRTAEQFASTIENTGGSIVAVNDEDYLNVYGSALTAAAPLAFELLGDVVSRPAFAASEFSLAQAQTLSGLQLNSSSPGFLASKMFRAGLYGRHPYGATATPASVQAITRDDVVRFHAAHVRPRGALLVVAGDVTLAQVKAWANTAFATWTGASSPASALPTPPQRRATEIILVHRPGSVQSNVLIGNLAIGPADSARLAAELALQVLGGGSDGRLFKILREQKSWTYGAYASMTRPLGIGRFEANTEVRTEVTDSAVTEMLAQLTRLSREPIPPKELEDTRGGMVGSFPLSIETPSGLASLIAFVKLYGLPASYLQTYRPRLSAVTAAQVREAAARVVRPSEALIVVVGDGVALYERLAKIAPVTLRTVEGDRMEPGDLVPKATPARFDVSQLAARRDSFVILLQGNPFGHLVSSVTKTAAGWTFEESTVIGDGAVQMRSALESDGTLTPRSLRRSGTVQAQSVVTTIDFADGTARGTAQNATPTGPVTKSIDVAMPAGTLVSDALRSVVPLFAWSAQAQYSVSALTTTSGAVETYRMTVVGTETVTVPAGTFECWKIEQTGGPSTVHYYLRKSDRRVVQFGSPMQPVVSQLAQ